MATVFYAIPHGLSVQINSVTVELSHKKDHHDNIRNDFTAAYLALRNDGFIKNTQRFKATSSNNESGFMPMRSGALAIAMLQAVGKLPAHTTFGAALDFSFSADAQSCRGAILACDALVRICTALVIDSSKPHALGKHLNDAECYAVSSVTELVRAVDASETLTPEECKIRASGEARYYGWLSQKTIDLAKRIAITGEHALITMTGRNVNIASLVADIKPALTPEQERELCVIYDAAGMNFLDRNMPYRAPHHSISLIGLMGGGMHAGIGELHLAQHGTLVLDDFPEFRTNTIEHLRTALRDGMDTPIGGVMRLNAQVVAFQNGCPCANPQRNRECVCYTNSVARYKARVDAMTGDMFGIVETIHNEDRDLTIPYTTELVTKLRKEVLEARAHKLKTCVD